MGHIQGQSRHQATLFPESLDELIPGDHPIRVIDAFVESLDLAALAFAKAEPAATGRPPYHPGDLLKLYLYGYLNQVRSSRRLEREAARNIELLWLLNRLCPDFKTIANFRRDNPPAIVGVCRAFTLFCREQALFGAELVAIDGSKFEAVASRKQVVTPPRIETALASIEERIGQYLRSLDEADVAEPAVPASGDTHSAIETLRARQQQWQTLAGEMQANGETQRVATEPEARLMRASGGGHVVGYNVQTAVDAQHHLIVSFAVCQDGNDHRQLYPMATAAQETLEAETLTVVADTGYRNGEQAAQCEARGITPVAPAPRVVNPRGDYFTRERFDYDPATDTYRCPAGEVLTPGRTDRKQQVRHYTTSACRACARRPPCTAAPRRTVLRHFYAAQVEAMDRRAQERPELMTARRCLAEHPFGTIKHMMGLPRFLVRGLTKVKAEMALSVTAYNLRRVINILGVPAMLNRLAT